MTAARTLDPVARFGLRATLLCAALLAVAIPFGLLLAQVTSGGPLTHYDDSVAVLMNDKVHDSPGWLRLLNVVSFTGKPIFLFLVITPACLWLLRNGARRLVLFLVVTCLGGGIVDTIVKVTVSRPRPRVPHPVVSAFGKSFPSGHSMQAVVCYGALLLVLLPLLHGVWRRVAISAYVGTFLAIGASRLSLSVHFITDVVGGYVLGAAWLMGMVAAFEIWRVERGRPRTDPVHEGLEPAETAELVAP